MTLDREQELERFKVDIDLRDFAGSYGFELDRKKSGKASAVLRHPGGDKIIVSRKANRHYVYSNVHDEQDRGTVIDFVSNREPGLSLGQIRQKLRSWKGDSISPPPSSDRVQHLQPSEYDITRVVEAWDKAEIALGKQAYLNQSRSIPSDVLLDPKFTDKIRTDARGNALFPHFNSDGNLCGFEIKNKKFTSFSPGGLKGLWQSNPTASDRKLVIAETAIDALSVAGLFGTHGHRFISTAGQLSPLQVTCLQAAARAMPEGSEVLLAMDHDNAGKKLAETIRTALVDGGYEAKRISNFWPDAIGEDWNDALQRTIARINAPPTPSRIS